MTHSTTYHSPIGPLGLTGGPGGLNSIRFDADGEPGDPGPLAEAITQLDEYFAGERREFDLEVDLHGTEFQRSVWEQLLMIPYGETVTYGELARRIGAEPERVRAVGGAVGSTPVPIVVPCHRVIGANGSLTGYGGGLPRKRALLDLEQGIRSLAAF
jgi:methylated-DNA-[protein]-cysteine S-methyltransferase